jgi:uncharacterized YigZ family protein
VSSPADPDRYLSVEDGPETELKVKGSRFLGRVFRVTSADEAHERLQSLRKRHHSATHHCSASRTGLPESSTERFDDDGEPSGTAGRPILNQLLGLDVYDTLVVVTRYFGGTKLGTGGLARAYGDTAALALEAAPKRVVLREAQLDVGCHFDDVGSVEACLARSGSDILRVERAYDPSPRLNLIVRRSRAKEIAAAIVEATAGRATVIHSRDSC